LPFAQPVPLAEILTPENKETFQVGPEHAGERLDQFLLSQLPATSRTRVQQLIRQKVVLVGGAPAKASRRLHTGEAVSLSGDVARPPLRAAAEDIPLNVLYEDDDLAVIMKPAGMMVHAGAGSTDDERNRGTLVNALLHRFAGLSGVAGELRPGIVHRLDKQTSGLIVVAKNDGAHRRLANEFSRREVRKSYVALVHGWLKEDRGTVAAAISRDLRRRTRMTTRRRGGRQAITHYAVERRIDSEYGRFTLLRLRIETGRTHQIRVHLASLGHPVVGDTLYGAPREIAGKSRPALSLDRHFLHASELEFPHPGTGKILAFSSPIPEQLGEFLGRLE
jgi:23S rRNA pseudouridine1911/1915/1917 synthase